MLVTISGMKSNGKWKMYDRCRLKCLENRGKPWY
ncbi:hypothetical protein EJP82_27295 [Paenibacillus anaericanus]|uniref:Uncharacterized protein n=1 Tax=Paenibacillus anaericanus TaxID=170367 RepID=A0A3S1D6Z2_9BACL|nr:hypothetical protein EJP82_27295 [Paenibacillus anaericanus]